MGGLSAALDSAFEEVQSEPAAPAPAPEPSSTADSGTTVADKPAQEAAPEPAPEPTEEAFHNPTREELELINANPALKKAYEAFRRGFSTKTQALAEERKRIDGQAQFWDALNNPQTQRQAIEALARSVGVQLAPSDAPQREQAAQLADGLSEKWGQVVGPEAAQLLRPLIEETARAAMAGQLEPLKKAAEYVDVDARTRQADAQVSQFKALAEKKGWNLTPEVEAKMATVGLEIAPTRRNPLTGQLELAPIESVEQGVKFMERVYRLATADTAESDIEKRIYERMQKAADTAEPARGVPSTGREKRTGVTKDMNLNDALDVAMKEAAAKMGW